MLPRLVSPARYGAAVAILPIKVGIAIGARITVTVVTGLIIRLHSPASALDNELLTTGAIICIIALSGCHGAQTRKQSCSDNGSFDHHWVHLVDGSIEPRMVLTKHLVEVEMFVS